jgi:hypothetical protein
MSTTPLPSRARPACASGRGTAPLFPRRRRLLAHRPAALPVVIGDAAVAASASLAAATDAASALQAALQAASTVQDAPGLLTAAAEAALDAGAAASDAAASPAAAGAAQTLAAGVAGLLHWPPRLDAVGVVAVSCVCGACSVWR